MIPTMLNLSHVRNPLILFLAARYRACVRIRSRYPFLTIQPNSVANRVYDGHQQHSSYRDNGSDIAEKIWCSGHVHNRFPEQYKRSDAEDNSQLCRPPDAERQAEHSNAVRREIQLDR